MDINIQYVIFENHLEIVSYSDIYFIDLRKNGPRQPMESQDRNKLN